MAGEPAEELPPQDLESAPVIHQLIAPIAGCKQSGIEGIDRREVAPCDDMDFVPLAGQCVGRLYQPWGGCRMARGQEADRWWMPAQGVGNRLGQTAIRKTKSRPVRAREERRILADKCQIGLPERLVEGPVIQPKNVIETVASA